MPHTPLPLGEPVSPRDAEPRWFEPVAPTAIIEPIAPEDEWSAASESAHGRDPSAWRDVRWVEFGDPEQPVADEPPATPGVAGAAAVESPPPRPAAEVRPAPELPDGATQPDGSLRSRLAAGIGRLLRFGAAAVSLVVVAIFLYHGGEMLAGFAGAMTPPSPAPAPSATAAVVPDRLPKPTVTPAGGTDNRPTEYLARARAGEPTAQYNLAVLYARGDGVAQDYPSAASWFRKAAESGNPAAQFNLAVMYERGLGLPRDNEAAFAWYRRAAERSYPAAEYNLALAYADGRGTPRDPTAAARWYHDAAVEGIVPAMVNVAIFYETGEGTARSLPDAYAWYRAAARRGDEVASDRALELFQNLNGTDKAQAVLMAAAVAEAMLEPTAPAAAAILPVVAAPALPTVLKPARRRSGSTSRDAGPARRQPAG